MVASYTAIRLDIAFFMGNPIGFCQSVVLIDQRKFACTGKGRTADVAFVLIAPIPLDATVTVSAVLDFNLFLFNGTFRRIEIVQTRKVFTDRALNEVALLLDVFRPRYPCGSM